MQGIFRKENTDKALKYGIYRHLPTYEKIIRNLVSFCIKNYINIIMYIKLYMFGLLLKKDILDYYFEIQKRLNF